MASVKSIRTCTLQALVGVLLASVPQAFSQTPGAASSTTSAGGSTTPAASAAGASGAGTLAIESQAIAYEAIDDLAHVIAGRMVSCNVLPEERPKTLPDAEKYDPENRKNVRNPKACVTGKILLGTAANMASITAFEGFKAAAEALAASYQHVPPFTPKGDEPHAILKEGIDPTTLGPLGSAAASLLTAAKAQTTVTGATFAPTDQAFYNDLESAIKRVSSLDLVATAYPRQFEKANSCVIQPLLRPIYEQRQHAILQLAASNRPDPVSDLKEQDAEMTVLQNVLNNSGTAAVAGSLYGPPSILLGAALLRQLGEPDISSDDKSCGQKNKEPKYSVLIVSDDIAGGGSRTNLFFLVNLFWPGPHPSYNGGAIVSYSLRDQDGNFQDAGTLRYIYGYTKWRQPPLRKKSDPGFANFPVNGKHGQSGHWTPIY